jgi:hypothetical protein
MYDPNARATRLAVGYYFLERVSKNIGKTCRAHPSGAEARDLYSPSTARLKPCPFKAYF